MAACPQTPFQESKTKRSKSKNTPSEALLNGGGEWEGNDFVFNTHCLSFETFPAVQWLGLHTSTAVG